MLKSNPFGEIGSDSLYLSELSSHDKPWDIHRASAGIVSKLYKDIGYDRYHERVTECSKWLEFALKASETGEMDFKLFSCYFCRVRFCPVCQWRKSLMWRARFLKAVPRIISDYPKSRYIFLTLTVRNCQPKELRQTVKLMNNAWNKLRHRKSFPAIGFVRGLEVTRGKDGSAHPHFHCLLMVKPSYFSTGYLSHKAWLNLWKSCLKVDYHPWIHIEPVKPRKGVNISNVEALVPAICETLKYSVKPSDLVADPEWLGEITRQMFKTRTVSLGGIFKEYLSEDDPDDLIHGDLDSDDELENAPKLIFDWSEVIKRYAKRG